MDSLATVVPSTTAKSSPAPALKVVQPAIPIPIVVDDVISPSSTTLGSASHTPYFFLITQLLL